MYRRVWKNSGIQNKLLTGTIIVIHSWKEVSVVKSAGNIKENIKKLSDVAPNDGKLTGLPKTMQKYIFY